MYRNRMNVGKDLSQLTQFLIRSIFKISREGIDEVTFLEIVHTFVVKYLECYKSNYLFEIYIYAENCY